MALCYIFLLHQTTTPTPSTKKKLELCYIFLLHQTTTVMLVLLTSHGCVISFFYIKPQQARFFDTDQQVVLYLSSTSNHNLSGSPPLYGGVVLYLSSTSNHNTLVCGDNGTGLCYIFLLHQTTTGQVCTIVRKLLCYIFLLHQTTTVN